MQYKTAEHRGRRMPSGQKKTYTDTWLTDPKLLEELGPFDTDPCCATSMPWRTAKVMYHDGERDGLLLPWKGRTWLNPPYSQVLPWAELMVEHGNGISLTGARSPETKWAQLLMRHAGLIVFPSRRLDFYHADGTVAEGRWQPSMLCAFGRRNENKLHRWAKDNDALELVLRP